VTDQPKVVSLRHDSVSLRRKNRLSEAGKSDSVRRKSVSLRRISDEICLTEAASPSHCTLRQNSDSLSRLSDSLRRIAWLSESDFCLTETEFRDMWHVEHGLSEPAGTCTGIMIFSSHVDGCAGASRRCSAPPRRVERGGYSEVDVR
jgi:hypothetical protein